MTRDELVERLAQTSHETWMRQKVRDQGASMSELDPAVTHHDLERAEDVVSVLVDLRLVAFDDSGSST